jgi:hypothetical protein
MVIKEIICYSFLSVRSTYNFQDPFLEILNLRYFLMLKTNFISSQTSGKILLKAKNKYEASINTNTRTNTY